MFIYLAQPIDQANGGVHSVGGVTRLLRSVGISWYRPAGAFSLGSADLPPHPNDLRGVDEINRVALKRAEALVAWLPGGVPSLGVPAEVEEALRTNKPTLILTSMDVCSRSVQLQSWMDRGATVFPLTEQLINHWSKAPSELFGWLRWLPSKTAANHTEPTDLAVRAHPSAKMPTRAYDTDAGLDLAIACDVTLQPGESRMLSTGVWAPPPNGLWGLIVPRSSTWPRYRVDVRMAVIDAGYSGELMIQAHNQNDEPVTFNAGVRLAQYILLPAWQGRVAEVDELPDHPRGTNGYGSSGH